MDLKIEDNFVKFQAQRMRYPVAVPKIVAHLSKIFSSPPDGIEPRAFYMWQKLKPLNLEFLIDDDKIKIDMKLDIIEQQQY